MEAPDVDGGGVVTEQIDLERAQSDEGLTCKIRGWMELTAEPLSFFTSTGFPA